MASTTSRNGPLRMKKPVALFTWSYLGLGAALVVTYIAVGSEDAKSTIWTMSIVQAVVLAIIGTRMNKVDRRVLGVFLGLSCVMGISAMLDTDDASTTALVVSDLTSMLGGFGLITVSTILVRSRRGRDVGGVIADSLIIALGAWLITWVTLVRPTIDRSSDSWPITVLHAHYMPIGAIVLFLVVTFLMTETTRRATVWLWSGAIACSLIGDLLYALTDAGHLTPGATDVADGIYVLTYFLSAAGFLHPSATTLREERPSGAPRRLLGRLMLITMSLILPVFVLAVSRSGSGSDRLVRTISAVVLAAAVQLRVAQAVRSNAKAQAELLRAAQTDSLTGLPNRSLLLENVTNALHESWRTARCPTLFFLDLDRFKNINDSLGHAAGDQVLRTIAERLRSTVPRGAVVARISSDEFVVLDASVRNEGEAMSLAERLLGVFREPLALPQGDVFVTASVGVASAASNMAIGADDLLRHADTAMYRAKDAGRNCVALFDESMHERVAHRLAVETALYRALDRRELRLFHQPILDISSGEVVGFEALMRWEQSDGTIVSPAEFIPIAEDTGTIVPIGAWALLEALTQLRTWIDDEVCANTATMSVNVSPRQLSDPNFPSIVSEALMRSQVPPGLVWLEVTESMMIAEPELALATLRRLRQLGVRVALDDFGTGYSSLSLLQRFPLQRIKIDRAFVHGVADNPNDRSLVRTIVAMGTSLGLDMVAEGVESVHQLQVLSELGCTKAQGYLISHPVPADAMRSTVAALERLGNWPGMRRPDPSPRPAHE